MKSSSPKPSSVLIELIGGPFDGKTFECEDSGQPSLEHWNESEQALGMYRDCNDGEIGQRFSCHVDEFADAEPKYPIYMKAIHRNDEMLLVADRVVFQTHEYEVCERLDAEDTGEILIRAKYVDTPSLTSSTSMKIIGKARPR